MKHAMNIFDFFRNIFRNVETGQCPVSTENERYELIQLIFHTKSPSTLVSFQLLELAESMTAAQTFWV